ncbi:MAG: hypothetical protein DDT32_02215 [Syntrophomonadaceae bacterium]|nr:hypothetical protein [Bacillota bacterium]
MVMAEVNVGVPAVGTKVTVTPAGTPVAVRPTLSVGPARCVAVTVAVAVPPWVTVAAVGCTARLKSKPGMAGMAKSSMVSPPHSHGWASAQTSTT